MALPRCKFNLRLDFWLLRALQCDESVWLARTLMIVVVSFIVAWYGYVAKIGTYLRHFVLGGGSVV